MRFQDIVKILIYEEAVLIVKSLYSVDRNESLFLPQKLFEESLAELEPLTTEDCRWDQGRQASVY